MEGMVKPNKNFWTDKRVLVTGHTGFKGSWLCAILSSYGTKLMGYSLPAETDSLNKLLNIEGLVEHVEGDLLDHDSLKKAILEFQPDIVIHMAAQALVSESYLKPIETYSTNLIGTLHLLEILKKLDKEVFALMITTDKVYENRELEKPFKEEDKLGANDPYSTSKTCMELLIESHIRSFKEEFTSKTIQVVRAGNVIGGGDMANNRLLPDLIRSVFSGKPFMMRNPEAVRPWQHVFDVLNAYLLLVENGLGTKKFEQWNISPDTEDVFKVSDIVNRVRQVFPNLVVRTEKSDFYEANHLRLDSEKIRNNLGWKPQYDVRRSITEALEWYRAANSESIDIKAFSFAQIKAFFDAK
mgnify:CR=1 FL=1